MARSKTSGISTDAAGNRTVDKWYQGTRIFKRLGPVSQEEAESFLGREIDAVRRQHTGSTRPRVNFKDAADRYLAEADGRLKSIDTSAYHVEVLLPWIGQRPLPEIHDATLEPFVKHRLETEKVSLTTVNRSLEVVRRILNLSARKYRHESGLTWLESAPLITIDNKTARRKARKPYPLSWDEQDILFSELPEHLRQMALFKVNTGTRDAEVCRLRWDWEVEVPELCTSVFIVPGELVKNGEDRLVVLNGVARQVIEERRGIHPEHVFTWKRDWTSGRHTAEQDSRRGNPVYSMNNTAWQGARQKAAERYRERFGRPAPEGYSNVRVHDLKHTFGRRLRAAGVGEETRKVLLGHTNKTITTHYSAPELLELIDAANKIDRNLASSSITLLRSTKVPQKVPQAA